jgi:hypothetical protein
MIVIGSHYFFRFFFTPQWDRFTISNLLAAQDEDMRHRLWLSAVFAYIFTAYFCQLLYAEYKNFTVRRLKYLVQVRCLFCLSC